jgi:hypothetical protein
MLAKDPCTDNFYMCGGTNHIASFLSKKLTLNNRGFFISKYAAKGNCSKSCSDCLGVLYGQAFIDSCKICAGGTTGITPILDKTLCISTVVTNLTTEQFIHVYPNPAADHITINSTSAISEISIYNMIGELVLEVLPETGLNYLMDISKLPSAIYFINIKTKQRTGYQKLSLVR